MLNASYDTFSGRSWLPSDAWNLTLAASSAAYGCWNLLTKSLGDCPPYMLSPSMMTRSNGNFEWLLVICRATSYWGRSPVPLSPMTANFTESERFGSATDCAKTPAQASAVTISAIGTTVAFEDFTRLTENIHHPALVLSRELPAAIHDGDHDPAGCCALHRGKARADSARVVRTCGPVVFARARYASRGGST